MKRLFLAALAVAAFGVQLAAQPRYLVNELAPADASGYAEFEYDGASSEPMAMSGGLEWHGGFTLSYDHGTHTPGHVAFELGGEYETLMFVFGSMNTNTGAGGSGADTEPCIFTVHVDGKKVLDEVVYPYGLPERAVLDVRGAHEVKFGLVDNHTLFGVAEATLWKAGEMPVETGNIPSGMPQTTELVSGLPSYYQNFRMTSVSPQGRQTSMKINGREYYSGLDVNMDMSISGASPGWAYFNLQGQYATLSFTVGPIDNTDGHRGSGWLTVEADGKIIREMEIHYDDIAQDVRLDVTGCRMLKFYTEQASGSSRMGIADIRVYPAGVEPVAESALSSSSGPDPAGLPDVCKLLSNIPPYAAGALVEKQIYDGSSEHITFSMGGVRFNEGIVFYDMATLLDDNTSSYAMFDLGGEFDYVSFTAGYIGKSGAMNNDVLRVYADDELVLEAPLVATAPNRDYVVPIRRCRRLRFENQGSGTLDVAAYGVADVVLYRGEPVENDLFVHPRPECPPEIDLIDLGAPYIHYVSPMKGKDIFYDGSTMRNYFDLNGQRITKGFLLETSVHFSLDHGVLSGTGGAAAGAIGSTAVGSAFVSSGIAVGGAVIGSSLAGVASFLMLAAGGEAMENSLAAFNTYGEYNTLTFTVACLDPPGNADSYKETLLIGADGKVAAELAVYETMEPQTITVPIDGCGQLMFWLANTDNWSGQFLFYDLKLSKERRPLDIPKPARISQPVLSRHVWTVTPPAIEWERPRSSGRRELDSFLSGVSNVYESLHSIIKNAAPLYDIRTYYLETDAGQVCKAVQLMSHRNQTTYEPMYITNELSGCERELRSIIELRRSITELGFQQVGAAVDLVGLAGITHGGAYSQAVKVLKECSEVAGRLYQQKMAETEFLRSLFVNALEIDGKRTTEKTIFNPLSQGETPPTDLLQLVRYFDVK